jgi:hypothetical protein
MNQMRHLGPSEISSILEAQIKGEMAINLFPKPAAQAASGEDARPAEVCCYVGQLIQSEIRGLIGPIYR